MKYSILIIAVLAIALIVSGCSQVAKSASTTQNTPSNNAPPVTNTNNEPPQATNTVGAVTNGSTDLSSDITIDNPTEPGSLDNITVSDSVPQ